MIDHDALRMARLKRRWSQEELASRIGVTVKTVGRWENGMQKAPTPVLMAQALGLPLDEVFHCQPVTEESGA